MKIVIDLEDLDLEDFIEINEDNASIPTLNKIFKDEIKNRIADKIIMGYDLKSYINYELYNPIANKIREYIESGALTEIVSQFVKEKVDSRSGLKYWDSYKQDVEKVVSDCLTKQIKALQKEIDQYVIYSSKIKVEQVISTLFVGNKLSQFVDVNKISDYIIQNLNDIQEEK